MIIIGNSPANIVQWLAVPVRPFDRWAIWNEDDDHVVIDDADDDNGDDNDNTIDDDADKVQERLRRVRHDCHWEANLCRGTVEQGAEDHGDDEDRGGDDDSNGGDDHGHWWPWWWWWWW